LEESPAIRYLPDLIKAVLAIIPERVQEKNILRIKLGVIVDNYDRTTLDDLANTHNSVTKILTTHLVITDEDWYDEFFKVYTGQLDYKKYI
jgi:hypothetical protein